MKNRNFNGIFANYTALSLENQPSFCTTNMNSAWAFNQADVYFDVSRQNNALFLKGYKQGTLAFNMLVPDSMKSFETAASGDFQIESCWNGSIRFSYFDSESRENLSLIIARNGDVEFQQSNEAYTGWGERKIYGVKTSGTLKCTENQAFYALIAHAYQIVNYGTLMAGNARFFQNYLFNSGVIQLGKIPDSLPNLRKNYDTNLFAEINYQYGSVENYGTIRSQGAFNIYGNGTYQEHGFSDFNRLQTDIDIQIDPHKTMAIRQEISGDTHYLNVQGQLLANQIDFPSLRRLDNSGNLHASSTANFIIGNSFSNSGTITAADMVFHSKLLPTEHQTGMIFAQNSLDFQSDRQLRPLNAPKITEHPYYHDYLVQHAPDPESYEFQRLQDEFYRRVGYNKNKSDTDPNFNNLPALIARKLKKIIYTDHYLNTITYIYKNGRIVEVKETGYIFQRRTKEEKEITQDVPAGLNQNFINLNALLDSLIQKQDKNLSDGELQSAKDNDKRKQSLRQSFSAQLSRVLSQLHCDNAATRCLMNDEYFRDVSNWDNLSWLQQIQLTEQRPESQKIGELISDAREWIAGKIHNLSTDAKIFINEVLIPLQAINEYIPVVPLSWGAWSVAVATKVLPWILPTTMVPAAAYTAVTAAEAILPKALAIAAKWAAAPAAVTLGTFFKAATEGKTRQTQQRTARVVDTQESRDNFIKRLLQMKKIEHWHDISRRTTYRDINPKRRHFYQKSNEKWEIEVYDKHGNHIGVIKPSDGILRRELAVPGRRINVD